MLRGFLVDCDCACWAAFTAGAWVCVLVCGFLIVGYIGLCFPPYFSLVGMVYVRVVRWNGISGCGVRGEGCHTSRPDDIVRRDRVDDFLGV